MSLCDLQRPVSLKCSRSKEADRRKAAVAVVNEVGEAAVDSIDDGRLSIFTFKIQTAASILGKFQYKSRIVGLHGCECIVDFIDKLLRRINAVRNRNGISVRTVLTGRQMDVQAVIRRDNGMFLIGRPAAVSFDLVIRRFVFLKYGQGIVISIRVDPVDFRLKFMKFQSHCSAVLRCVCVI